MAPLFRRGVALSYLHRSPLRISACAQGRILSVFSRAFDHANDSLFYSAIKAMAPFRKPVAEGGVQARFPDGGIAFEEYPYKLLTEFENGGNT